MIIFIHGFGGSGEGRKAKVFRAYFKSIGEPFIAPSLPYVPELAIKTLEELIESYHGNVKFIGSSLGGYYTMYLAQKYTLQAVLLNPSIYPDMTLQCAHAPNFYDESHFEWNERHIEMLKGYRTQVTLAEKMLLLLQKDDAFLDYREALEYLPKVQTIIEEGDGHGFDGIEDHFERIRTFFGVGDYFKHTMKPKGVDMDNEDLAVRLGDLYYDALGDFLGDLSNKLGDDAKVDEGRGRKRLAGNLYNAANAMGRASTYIARAWGNCEVYTLKWLEENGSNRKE